MGLNATAYRRLLQALLPQGLAWPREPGATLTRFLDGAAEEFARIDARIQSLFEEADPSTSTELLVDWERVAGLPDNCNGELRSTVQARRQDLLSKLSATGGQSRDYFIAVAAALGFVVTIEEFKPFRAGQSSAGDAVNGGDWPFTWRVNGPSQTVTYFQAGQSAAGEPLAFWGNEALECRMRQLKPAHTILQFAYESVALLNDGSPLLLNSGEELRLNE